MGYVIRIEIYVFIFLILSLLLFLINNKVVNVLFSFSGTKRRKRPKLAIFSKFNPSGTLKKKLGTKEEKLKNDIMKLNLRDRRKIWKTWLVFGEKKKKQAR